MAEMTTVARPYAIAAFNYAVENKAVNEWLEMLTFAAEVAKNDTVDDLLRGGSSVDASSELFINLCGDQLNDNSQNFIKVLAENKRLLALPEILVLFTELKADYEKEIEVEVTSATDLTDTQQQEISGSLEKRLARKVKLNCSVDSDLIAGFVVQAGDLVIDGSFRSKINRLADSLQA
jgi:F-type H+-transporting ATPase subunit delta